MFEKELIEIEFLQLEHFTNIFFDMPDSIIKEANLSDRKSYVRGFFFSFFFSYPVVKVVLKDL